MPNVRWDLYLSIKTSNIELSFWLIFLIWYIAVSFSNGIIPLDSDYTFLYALCIRIVLCIIMLYYIYWYSHAWLHGLYIYIFMWLSNMRSKWMNSTIFLWMNSLNLMDILLPMHLIKSLVRESWIQTSWIMTDLNSYLSLPKIGSWKDTLKFTTTKPLITLKVPCSQKRKNNDRCWIQ